MSNETYKCTFCGSEEPQLLAGGMCQSCFIRELRSNCGSALLHGELAEISTKLDAFFQHLGFNTAVHKELCELAMDIDDFFHSNEEFESSHWGATTKSEVINLLGLTQTMLRKLGHAGFGTAPHLPKMNAAEDVAVAQKSDAEEQ